MSHDELKTACSYIVSELRRIQTVAGTLATIERDHYNRLTGFDQRELLDVAVEEQSAARQLGMVRQVCAELAQKVEEIQAAIEGGELREAAAHAPSH